MSINEKELKKLTEFLSKIALEDHKMATDINSILEYIDLLNEVDTTNVVPTVNVVKMENSLRKDTICEKSVSPSELLECSGQKVVASQIAIGNIMK